MRESLARRQGSERSLRRYKGADMTVKRTARPRSIEFVSVVEQSGNFESKENARDPSRLFPYIAGMRYRITTSSASYRDIRTTSK